MTERLSNATLAGLPAEVERPGYDRAAVKTGVVHLGIGAFHRAHQAVVFDDALAVRRPALGRARRLPAFARRARSAEPAGRALQRRRPRRRHRPTPAIIGAVQGVLVAPGRPRRRGRRHGLCRRPPRHPDRDREGLSPRSGLGRSADRRPRRRRRPGRPVEAPHRARLPRRGPGRAPPGAVWRPSPSSPATTFRTTARASASAVLAMAEAHDPALADWIEAEGAFPQTMVDRIVPATTPEDIDAPGRPARRPRRGHGQDRALHPVGDRGPVRRPAPRLRVARRPADRRGRPVGGRQAAPAERRPFLPSPIWAAWPATSFVHEVVAIPAFRAFVEAPVGRGGDHPEPAAGPRHPRLSDRPDGPVLAIRRCSTARARSPWTARRSCPSACSPPSPPAWTPDQPIDALALGVAGWIKWQEGVTETGDRFTVDDPMAARIADALSDATTAEARVRAVSSLSEIVSPDTASDVRFTDAVSRHLEGITRDGVLAHLTRPA